MKTVMRNHAHDERVFERIVGCIQNTIRSVQQNLSPSGRGWVRENVAALPLLTCLLAALLCVSCASTPANTEDSAKTGYTHGNLYRSDVHSVAVPIFENRTFTTGIERELTDAIIKEIQTRTPYFIAPPDRADTELVGVITAVEKSRLNRARGSGLVREMIVKVTVNFEWRDQRTGKVFAARKDFQAGDEYIASLPVSERPEIGQFGASQAMAREIVAAMRDQW
jgi:hypothetical protein